VRDLDTGTELIPCAARCAAFCSVMAATSPPIGSMSSVGAVLVDNKNRGRRGVGRPRVGAILIGVRVPPADVAALDTWIKTHTPGLSRSEAIRRLVELGLKAKPKG
jgi:hypothetical protein